MEKKTIGGFLSALRKANGLTQRQLAEKLNVSDKAVSRWERDEAMPDLTLIPVLAEIFGVTTDEILRGERHNPDASAVRSEEKAVRQKKHILTDKRTKLKIRSTVSIGIAILGLIAAMICNFGFLRTYIGFMVGCVFYLSAMICQVIFVILHLSGVDEEMLTQEELGEYRLKTYRQSGLTFGTIIAFTAATLPLIVFPWDTYQGLDAGPWALYGLLYAAIVLAVIRIAYVVISLLLAGRGLLGLDTKLKKRYRLQIRYIGITALVLAALLLIQGSLNAYLPSAIMKGTEFDSWDSFKIYMETPKPYDGSIAHSDSLGIGVAIQTEPLEIPVESVPPDSDNVFVGEDGSLLILPEEPLQQIYDENGALLCEFQILNEYVYSFKHTEKDGSLKITVYTYADKHEADLILDDLVNPAFVVLYPLSILFMLLAYRKKVKQLQ